VEKCIYNYQFPTADGIVSLRRDLWVLDRRNIGIWESGRFGGLLLILGDAASRTKRLAFGLIRLRRALSLRTQNQSHVSFFTTLKKKKMNLKHTHILVSYPLSQ
jgi:hypothetical protein